MPIVLSTLSWVGVVAMLWVGGHILLVGADELGLHAPYDWVHHIEVAVHDATGGLGAALGWLTNTFFSAVLGLDRRCPGRRRDPSAADRPEGRRPFR